MNLYEDTNPHELKELLRQVDKGETVLPDFQRDFVWDPNATMELIISIAQNFPAGSLLRIRNTHDLFAYREFEGAPSINGKKPTFLILDGQQRITSLYQAFFGKGENRYYIDLQKMLSGKDFEDCIFYLRSSHPKIAVYDLFETQAQNLILPLSILKSGFGGFSQWVIKISQEQENDNNKFHLLQNLLSNNAIVQTIDDYRFPVVTLTDETSAEAVCTIFETLNRTGVKLSPFELLTARFWHQGLNLRQRWSDAKNKFPIFEDFFIDPYYVLQIISLISKKNPSCKRTDVMDLEKPIIEQNWDKSIEGLYKALSYLQLQCGVLTPGLLPYSTIVIPMAAMFAAFLDAKGPLVGLINDKVGQWFWCAVFGQKYESSPNSQSAVDYSEFVEWIKSGKEPQTIKDFSFNSISLRDTTGRQRAVYRGTLSLVFRHESRDFHSHKPLTLAVISENHIDDHHIFPDKFLEKRGVQPKLRDCVLNHTYIDRETNQRISNRAPSDYMDEIKKIRGIEKFNELLKSHLIPIIEDGNFLKKDDFDGFLNWRQERIFKEIKKVTGLA